jgi:hypothetical protein
MPNDDFFDFKAKLFKDTESETTSAFETNPNINETSNQIVNVSASDAQIQETLHETKVVYEGNQYVKVKRFILKKG